MISRTKLIGDLTKWRDRLGDKYEEEIAKTVIDMTISKIHGQPQANDPDWKKHMMKHFVKGE